jgi:hypothetical protein
MSVQDRPFNKAEQLKPVLRVATLGPNKQSRTVLADVFGIDEKDDYIIHSRVEQTRRLIREVERDVKSIPGINYEIFLSWVPSALHMFTVPDLNQGWHSRPLLKEGDLIRIDFCIDVLKKHFTEDHISEEKLKEVKKTVEELKADILGAGFEPELKEALVDALQALLTAIDEYSLRGISRIKEGLSIAVGTVVINFGLLRKPGAWEHWQKYSQRFIQVVNTLGTLIGFASKHKDEIGEGIKQVRGLLTAD